MKRKTLALAPLALVATLSQAAETVKIYNWSDYRYHEELPERNRHRVHLRRV